MVRVRSRVQIRREDLDPLLDDELINMLGDGDEIWVRVTQTGNKPTDFVDRPELLELVLRHERQMDLQEQPRLAQFDRELDAMYERNYGHYNRPEPSRAEQMRLRRNAIRRQRDALNRRMLRDMQRLHPGITRSEIRTISNIRGPRRAVRRRVRHRAVQG
jgi:hypothetical protein